LTQYTSCIDAVSASDNQEFPILGWFIPAVFTVYEKCQIFKSKHNYLSL